MVSAMAHCDTEVVPVPDFPGAVLLPAPDWRWLYEQALERAEAAEARVEELTRAEVAARTEAGRYRALFEAARRKRLAAVGDAAEARRAAKDALAQEAEVRRLHRLLADAGVESGRGGVAGLRRGNARLRRENAGLRRENAGLRRENAGLRRRAAAQETETVRLRTTRAVHSKALYGRRSEKLERPGTGRPRGQVRGAPCHGRTPRPGLEERVEEHEPPVEARMCGGCGKPYAAVGAEESTLLEIEVKAHRRVIRRGRWRRTCDCASSPAEVSAAPAPRLFPNTSYGTSVWSRVLYERYACLRPARRVAGWLSDQGLPVAAGTLADSVPRFVPLFEPLGAAILAHQDAAALRHADETAWRVQALRAEGRSARAWLWVSVGDETAYFHIDPGRSAEAARTLLGGLRPGTVIVCDRYSAYKRLARLLDGMATLQFCWAHMRRDFIRCAAGQADLAGWRGAWLERIAAVYRLNAARLACHDPGAERQGEAFEAAQAALAAALDGLFAEAGRELEGLPDDAREGRALRSLANHREGLAVFLEHPHAPMDNNLAERLLRGPAIGRRLSFGSDSRTGAKLAALMYSVVGTLNLNRIDVPRWLDAWLAACAGNGGRPPDDLAPWLPWSMDDARRRELTAPG